MSAALELLQKGKVPDDKGEADMAKAAVAEPEAELEEEEIELSSLKTHKDIDTVVETFELEVPDDWSKLTIAQKKKYLEDNYDDSEDEADEEATEETPDKAPDESEAEQEAPDTEDQVEDSAAGNLAEKIKAADTEPVAAPEPEPEAEKPKAKKPAKKAAPKSDVTEYGEMIADIEKMDKETALNLAGVLTQQSNVTMFQLGGVLARIQENGWFEPYASFQEYVEAVHGMNRRRALYWVSIYKNVVESDLPFEEMAHVQWSKLKEIVGIIDEANYKDWIKLAEENTVNDLIEHVRAYKKKMASGDPSDADAEAEVKSTTTKSFKLFADQVETVDAALEKATEEHNSATPAVSLEMICLAYLGTPVKKVESNPLNFEGMDFEEVITAVANQFPDQNITVE